MCRSVLVAAVLSLGCVLPVGAQQEIDKELCATIKAQWEHVENKLVSQNTMEIVESGFWDGVDHSFPDSSLTIIRKWEDGKFVHKLVPKNGLGQAWGRNNHYAFYVEPATNQRWFLGSEIVDLHGEFAGKSAILSDISIFEKATNKFCFSTGPDRKYFINQIFDLDHVEILQVASDPVGAKTEIKCEIALLNVPDEISQGKALDATIVLDNEKSFLPTSFKATHPYVNIEVEFSEFTQLDGLWYPALIRTRAEVDGKVVSDYSQAVSLSKDTISEDTFTLTAFGLPEPDWIARGQSWHYYLVAGLVMIGMAFTIRKRFVDDNLQRTERRQVRLYACRASCRDRNPGYSCGPVVTRRPVSAGVFSTCKLFK